jgi:hypothetical protein
VDDLIALGRSEYEAAEQCSPGDAQLTKGAVLVDLWNGSAREAYRPRLEW